METITYTPEESIAAVATGLIPSALGVIRTTGKDSIEMISRLFSRPKALLSAGGNSIVYGWIIDPLKKESGEDGRVDEVLISVFKSPKSFTGENMAEISCHGGIAVVTEIYNLLLKNGFRKALRGEFTFRAYINGKTDLTRAEAIREIIESKTDKSSGRAAGRLAGSVYDQIKDIQQLIVKTIAAIEVGIEYPEDEQTIADAFDSTDLLSAAEKLKSLSDSWKSEKLYQDGARVVLCGKTNVGKSSLFNALLKEDRSIVSDIEGTTRDWIESWVNFDGVPARLFDTAGLRKTEDLIEQSGVERTKDLSKDADIVLYLADASDSSKEKAKIITEELEALLPDNKIPVLLVWNKCDSLASGFEEAGLPYLREDSIKKIPALKGQLHISAQTGKGIAALSEAVKNVLTGSLETDREKAGLGSSRQEKNVKEAYECVAHALKSVNENYSLDAAVQDLEDSLEALAEVTGEVTPDDILETIFSNFCVGK